MFKNTRGFLFSALAALALSACGGGSVGEGDGNTGEPGDEVTGIEITLGAAQAQPGQTNILVRATLEGGTTAITGKTITFASTGGATLTAGTRTTNSAGIAESRLTAPTQAGQITVTISGEGFLTSDTITIVPGAPANIDVEPLPNKVPLGGTSSVRAIVTDAYGNPISGATVRYAVSDNNTGGRFPTSSQAISDADGATRVDYTAGATSGTDELRVTVAGAAPGTGTVNASSANAAPGSIQLTMNRTNLQAGGSAATATAFVADEDGNPIQGVLVGFSATGGTIQSSAETNVNGRASVAYTPPPTGGTFIVRAEIGTFSDEETVIVAQSPQTVAAIDLQLSSVDLSSSAQSAATGVLITATVLDADNGVVPGQAVSFASSSGVLTPQGSSGTANNVVTDGSGQARVALTVGSNPRNRPITITVKAGSITRVTTVNVVGTRFSAIEGPSALRAGATEGNVYTVRLQDADSNGIAGQQVRFLVFENASTTPVELGTVTTASNPRGEASIAVSPRAGLTQLRLVAELVTQPATPATPAETPLSSAEFPITINNRTLSFDNAVSLEQIPINVPRPVVVSLRQASGSGTVPVNGAVIRLSVTRGNVVAGDGVNCPARGGALNEGTTGADGDGAGLTTFCIQSNNTGPVTIAALTVADGLSVTLPTSFISTVPDEVLLQATPATVGTNSTAEIRATVRDANDNRVVGQTVTFAIVTDPTNGSLSSTTAVTNDVGVASVNYRSSSVASARDGVVIRASVPGVTPATATLTVGNQALRITLGTSNIINKAGDASYKLPYLAIVRDSAGNPVPEAEFTLNIRPLFYLKGEKIYVDPVWIVESTAASCRAEDTDVDGVLDVGEDTNGNGSLDPSDGANVPRTVTLDPVDASAEFDVTYPRDRSFWVVAELTAIARVGGTEAVERAVFTLPGAAEDHNQEDVAPPGQVSPFGIVKDCTVADSGGYAKFTTTTQTVDENTTVTISVVLEGLVNKEVSVPIFTSVATSAQAALITVSPSASRTITIPAGQLSGSTTFSFNNASTTGEIIPVTLTIGKPVNAEIGNPSTQTVRVRP